HDGTAVSALNSSGWAGSNASAAALREDGLTAIPQHHPAAVTIPGCVAGWFELHDRHGRLPMGELLAPAIALGREGFPASTEYSRATTRMARFLSEHEQGAQLLVDGRPPRRGDRVRRPNLADTLERVAEEGPTAIYEGSVAQAISDAVSGMITAEDVAAYSPDWVTPLSLDVFGVTGWTIPPNSQGYLTLATLHLFESMGPGEDPASPHWAHLLIESYRAIVAERDDVVSDPAHTPLPDHELLSADRLERFARDIDLERASVRKAPSARPGGTSYLCTVDAEGMGVSFIQSNFRGIGSGFGAGGAGFVLHDRGGGFDLRPGHPNEIAPGKRPLHTLSPSLWTSGGRLRAVLGTRGGHQQPQLVAQVAALVFGAGRTPGMAQHAPRWTISEIGAAESVVEVESGTSPQVVEGLARRGHSVRVQAERMPGWGPVSLIELDETGLRTAAADPRVDTTAAAVW
ncbi:MAG TPA: gamma-glutamyltransferase, partial [Acidimicrobiia bacterium]|nr:gamma-glutamyltransferase [Acidimicrobiia bacterium]